MDSVCIIIIASSVKWNSPLNDISQEKNHDYINSTLRISTSVEVQ